jgi:hypothetical protein
MGVSASQSFPKQKEWVQPKQNRPRLYLAQIKEAGGTTTIWMAQRAVLISDFSDGRERTSDADFFLGGDVLLSIYIPVF